MGAAGIDTEPASHALVSCKHRVGTNLLFSSAPLTHLLSCAYRASVMICDRGALDGKSFVDNELWTEVLKETGHTNEQLLSRCASDSARWLGVRTVTRGTSRTHRVGFAVCAHRQTTWSSTW